MSDLPAVDLVYLKLVGLRLSSASIAVAAILEARKQLNGATVADKAKQR